LHRFLAIDTDGKLLLAAAQVAEGDGSVRPGVIDHDRFLTVLATEGPHLDVGRTEEDLADDVADRLLVVCQVP